MSAEQLTSTDHSLEAMRAQISTVAQSRSSLCQCARNVSVCARMTCDDGVQSRNSRRKRPHCSSFREGKQLRCSLRLHSSCQNQKEKTARQRRLQVAEPAQNGVFGADRRKLRIYSCHSAAETNEELEEAEANEEEEAPWRVRPPPRKRHFTSEENINTFDLSRFRIGSYERTAVSWKVYLEER